jgi:CDP-diacylglycerol--serine O-phosphatidyltransferase
MAMAPGVAPTLRKIAIIPTLLTLGNAICGFGALACASKIGSERVLDSTPYFAGSGWLILAAMVFDALDGYVARRTKSTSKFGVELDSLCDAISFGVAPAFLMLRLGPKVDWPRLDQALFVIACLYMSCAILRLARFNVETSPDPSLGKRFRGLPSPGAAGCIASLAILRAEFLEPWPVLDANVVRAWIEVFAPVGALVVALLMVSRVPYPHLTKQILRGRRHFSHLVQVLVAGFVIMLFREWAIALLFWIYALGIPARFLWLRSWQQHPLPASLTGTEDRLPQ